MNDEICDRAAAMLDTGTDVETTCIEGTEYIRSDRPADDALVRGAEVELTWYISLDRGETDEFPFRVT